jgi:uncharacterized protein DUF4326
MAAKRIQLSRARGWRMPPNTVKIDRSTRWGNPFKIGESAVHPLTGKPVAVATAEVAVSLFELYLQTNDGSHVADAAQRELQGKDLACWCKPGNRCHGDVLLRISNAPGKLKRAA